jgi:hypothetical protein
MLVLAMNFVAHVNGSWNAASVWGIETNGA